MDNAYLIFDLAILVLLAVFAIRGAHRGLLLSLFSLVAVVVAFVGANFVANQGAPLVAEYLEPRFQQIIELRLDEEIKSGAADSPAPDAPDAAPDQLPLQDVLNVLKGMGLYQDLIATIDNAVRDGMTELAASAAASVATAVAQSVAYMALFLITFILIMILWTILSHILDLVAKLPGLSSLNHLGGALFGLVKCCIFLFLCAWVLRYSGNLIPEATVDKTYLLKFFLTTNPITLLLGV